MIWRSPTQVVSHWMATRGFCIVTLGRSGPALVYPPEVVRHAFRSIRQPPRAGASRLPGGLGLRGNPAPAAPPPNATRVYTLNLSTHRNPEGITSDEASRTFFVGAYNDGTKSIAASSTTPPCRRPSRAPGRSAVGLKIAGGRLYVAGGIYGDLRVYDVATKALVGTFSTGEGGFLNDLVVTDTGDVWVTDSVRPMLWHVTPAQIEAGSGDPTHSRWPPRSNTRR